MKYEILEWLKINKGSSEDISKKLSFPLDSVRVIVSRLKKDGEIEVVSNENGEYIYKVKNSQTNNNIDEYTENSKVWVAYRELFGFFADIMKNGKELISNRKLWNEIWNKREKYKDLIYEIGEKLPKLEVAIQ